MRLINLLILHGVISFKCKIRILFFWFILCAPSLFAVEEINADICVYGGTAGGVIAAVQAARMGKTVALVALNGHLGGMTTSGLGWTDIGHVDNDSGDYIHGVAREYYNRIGSIYGSFPTQPKFEPHVAEAVFNQMVQEQAGIKLYTNLLLTSVVKQGSQIIAAAMNDGTIFRAKMFIDASFTGDLMAKAGVTYTYGRESTNTYGENLNGIRPPNSDFTTYSIDPYVVKGNSVSGLLPLIQTNDPGTPGNADQRVQAYNFRLCLTTVATNKLAITAPPGYNTNQYELLARYVQAMVAVGTTPSASTFFTTGTPVPNNKIDANNSGALSTDFVGESAAYVEADDATRAQIWQVHKNYQQGFLYFLGTDLRLPASLRTSVANYGLCKDEFADNGGWPYELYVREGRRMISDYVMTQSNVFNQLVIPDSVGMAGYFTDSHYLQRVVVNGGLRNEGNARGDITVPYPISYRAIVPKVSECSNLFVPWCLSSSHAAYSSIRMEPVFMILGQACGTAACFGIDEGVAVQNINIAKLQSQLADDGQYLGIASSTNSTFIVDDTNAVGVSTAGSWTSSASSSGYYGSDYLHDGNTNKGLSSVTFTPTLPQNGSYQVYARWTSNANRATNAPIDVIHPGGTNTLFVDQTQQGGQWVLLMTTNFNAGTAGKVRIRNAGTTGFVIADAVEFVVASNIVNVWATDAQASRYGPQSGSFTINRTGVINAAMTVNLSIGGTAVNGVDYQPIANAVNIPAGIESTNISIKPYTNALPVGNKTVILSLASTAAYTTGVLAAATITISDTPINIWRLQHFGSNATNSAIAGDNANPAGDRVPNLMKYALGLNPTQAVTSPLFNFGRDTNGYFALSYTRPDPPPADVIYRVDASDNLVTWCTNDMCVLSGSIFFNYNGTATVTTLSDTPIKSSNKKFLRLSVSRK